MRRIPCLFLLIIFIVGCRKRDKPENLSSDKQITSFQLRPQENPGLTDTINGVISDETIVVYYDGSIPLNELSPYVTYIGSQLSPGSGIKSDFSRPRFYVVRAEDGSARAYRVIFSPNKLVYVGSDDGYLYAMEALTGMQQWKFDAGGAIRSSPTLAAGLVYVGSSDQHLYAVDSATGTLKWKVHFNRPVHSSPTVSNGTVYINNSGFLVALDAQTGVEQWKFATYDVSDHTSPTVSDGRIYVCNQTGSYSVGAVDIATGKLVWSYGGGIGSTNAAVADGVVYIGGEISKLMALDAATGVLKWKYQDAGYGSNTSPTVADGKVFISTNEGSIFAFNAGTGTLLWKFASQGIRSMGYQPSVGITVGLWSSPVYADGHVFAGNNDGLNYALDAATGSQLWTYGRSLAVHYGTTKATVANGTVIYGFHTGEVLAMDAASGEVKWKSKTNGPVYSGACIVGANGTVWHPGESGDRN